MKLLCLQTVVQGAMAEQPQVWGQSATLAVFLVRFKALGKLFNIQNTAATEVKRGEPRHMFLFKISLYGLSAN